MVKIFVAIFSVYFLLLQFIINSQSAPPQVFSYSPVKMSNLTKNSTKLQKCPPCPLVNEKSLTDISSKSICPPQTGKYLTGANVFVNSTSVATNSRGEHLVVVVVVDLAVAVVADLAVVVVVDLVVAVADHVVVVAVGLAAAAVYCCGCKRHRRQPCTAATMKMVDVLPTPPILMKIKSQKKKFD
ncbi:hypothetical protein Mgra_00003963 [Meloidogyne graminicola]|uniref:Uncharacterized protein n=1 Tax=Meloidogyne graminicola TaxID=189291 RepID=A0A8S9ZUA3_9BILA|nr:hypothetical protein Mgra_00003963 [Meloidogyne graminicola]